MKFGRVLVTTALVAVLASSLFSGWVGKSLPILKNPIAQAQSDGSSYSSLCQGITVPGDMISLKFDPDGTVNASDLTIEATLSNYLGGTSTFSGTLYRASTADNLYTSISTQDIPFAGDAYNVSAKASFTDHPASGEYKYFILTTITGGKTGKVTKDCSQESKTIISTNSSGGGMLSKTGSISSGGGMFSKTGSFTYDPCSGISGLMRTLGDTLTGGIGGLVAHTINCIVVGWANDLNNWLFNAGDYANGGKGGSQSPFAAVACISSTPLSIVGRAYAQGGGTVVPADPCSSSNTAGIGSFETELKNEKGSILRIWQISMGIVDVIVILALLAIAFANILHININVYAAKKALPGLIIGVILANSSILLIRFMADVCGALSVWAASIGGTTSLLGDKSLIPSLILIHFPMAIGKALALSTPSVVGLIILLISPILMIYYLFLIVAFIFALFKRIIILYFLVMVAPLAFVAYGVPSFQQYFTKWWDAFLRYLFLFPIILFGMAMTVILASTLHLQDLGNVWTVPGFVSIIMVFVAGTMVLKLPKIVTKGAIDAGAMFKKAIGYAPSLMAAGQTAQGWASKRKIAGLGEQVAEAKRHGTREQVKQLRFQRIKAIQSGDKWKKRLGTGRGLATFFGRPELIKEAYDTRIKRAQKNDYIAAMTKTGGLAGLIRGPVDEAEVAATLAADELKGADNPDKIRLWDQTLGKRHLDAVFNKKDPNKNIYEIMRQLTGGDGLKMIQLRKKYAEAARSKMYDNMKDFIEKPYDPNDPGAGGLGIATEGGVVNLMKGMVGRWQIHDLMKGGNRENKIFENRRGLRQYELGQDPDALDASNINRLDPGGQNPWAPFGTARKASPSGTATSVLSGSGTPPAGGGNGGAVQKVFVVNPVAIQNPQNEALASQLAASAEKIMSKFTVEELSSHVNNAKDVSELLSGDIGEALKGEFSSFVDSGGEELIKHAISAYANGGGLDAIRQRVAIGEEIGRSSSNLSAQSEALLDRLADKIGSDREEDVRAATKEVADALAPHIQKLGGNPSTSNQYADRLIGGFRQVIREALVGKKGLSQEMRKDWQATFGSFAGKFAQENGIDHITPDSLAKAIAHQTANQRQAAPTTPTPNVTNVSNVEQSTTVEQATPAPPEPPSES